MITQAVQDYLKIIFKLANVVTCKNNMLGKNPWNGVMMALLLA